MKTIGQHQSFDADRELLRMRNLFERLRAKQEMLISEEIEIITEVATAKYRVKLKPEVQCVIDELQTRAQRRSVGLFERLLTAIIHDVMPGDNAKAKLNLGVERGKPSLEIMVDNNGNLEDVMNGRGGSITNIISAGLRFIALSRLKGRRFIVLDEPDCWLRPDKVPAFSAVIDQLSREIGVQCLYISHHSQEYFQGKASMVELKKVDDRLLVNANDLSVAGGAFGGSELTGEEADHGLMEGIGISYIRLINFMSHEDSVIPLSANVTAIIGDNDIGKSAIVSAIRAVSYNAGNDSMIRHGQDKCVVEMGLEEGNVLRWTRKRRGSNKTNYRLETEDGFELHDEDNGKAVPEWVAECLSIQKVNGIDIHIGHQKEPVFMLGNSVPGTQRASLLSLGKESSYVQEMVISYGDSLRDDGRLVRKGEIRVAEVRGQLVKLRPIIEIEDSLNAYERERIELIKEKDKVEALEVMIGKMEVISKRIEKAGAMVNLLEGLPEPCDLLDTMSVLDIGMRISKCQKRVSQLSDLPKGMPKTPELDPVEGISNTVKRMEYAQKILSVTLPSLPGPPGLLENVEIEKVTKIMERLKTAKEKGDLEISDAKLEISKYEAQREELIESLGGLCPTCGSVFGNDCE